MKFYFNKEIIDSYYNMTTVYTISNEALQQFCAELEKSGEQNFVEMLSDFMKKHQKPKAKRGRPSKKSLEEKAQEGKKQEMVDGGEVLEGKPKKKRGRPSKKTNDDKDNPDNAAEWVELNPIAVADVGEQNPIDDVQRKKSGRPSKKKSAEDEVKKSRKEKEVVDTDYWGDIESLKFYRMVYQDEKSNKFWEYVHEDNRALIRFGKIGSKGTLQQKTFEEEAAAIKYLDKEMSNKENKGYTIA